MRRAATENEHYTGQQRRRFVPVSPDRRPSGPEHSVQSLSAAGSDSLGPASRVENACESLGVSDNGFTDNLRFASAEILFQTHQAGKSVSHLLGDFRTHRDIELNLSGASDIEDSIDSNHCAPFLPIEFYLITWELSIAGY